MMAKLAWFVLALACTAYWVVTIPVPEGFENPWYFRGAMAGMKIWKSVVSWMFTLEFSFLFVFKPVCYNVYQSIYSL